jgi:uncharacterized protein
VSPGPAARYPCPRSSTGQAGRLGGQADRHVKPLLLAPCTLVAVERRFVPRSPLGERLAERRAAVVAAAARRHASNVRVFGSVARGDDAPGSDIDLLVDVDPVANPLDLLDLGCELEDELGVKVDVGTPASLRAFLRADVLADAVAL